MVWIPRSIQLENGLDSLGSDTHLYRKEKRQRLNMFKKLTQLFLFVCIKLLLLIRLVVGGEIKIEIRTWSRSA